MSVDDSSNGINSSSAMTESTDTPRQTVEPLFFAAEAVIYVAMFLVGTVGNLLIVVFFLKSSSLRTTCNVFVVHLAVVDLVIIGLGVPLSLLLIVSSDIRRYDVACNVIGRIKTAGQTSSLCILLLIAVNRYTKICRRRYLYSRLFQTKSVTLMVTATTLAGLAFACHRVGEIDAESLCCVLFVGGSGEYVGIILYVAIVAVVAVLYVHIFRTIRVTRIRALQHSSPSPATNRSCRRVAASFVHVHRCGSGNDGSPGPAATATNTATAAGSVHRQRGSHKNDMVPNSSDASTKAGGSDARNVTSVSMNVVSSSRQAMAVRGEVREGEVEGEEEEGKEEENSSTSQANVVTDSNSAKTKGARRLRGIMRKNVAAAKPQDLSSSSSSGVEPDDRTRRPYATERQRGVRFVSLSPVSETEADDAAVNDKSLEEDAQEDYQDYQVSAWQTADSRSLANPSSTDSVDQGIINPRLYPGGSAQSGAAASEGNDYYTAPRHGTESTTAAWTTAASRCVSRSRNNSRNSSSSSSNTNNSAAAQQASTVRNNATSANSNNPAVANVFVITNIDLRRADAENAAAIAASTRKKKRRKNTQGGSEDDDNDNDNDTTLNSVARGPSKRKDPRVAMSCARGRADCNRTATSAAREGAARSDHRTAAAHRTEAAESAGNSLSRTKIMLTVATMFVLLYAPIIAIRTYEVLSASTARDDIWLAYAVAVAQLLVTLNSCVNFVIYGVMNGAFRLVLKQSFLRCRH